MQCRQRQALDGILPTLEEILTLDLVLGLDQDLHCVPDVQSELFSFFDPPDRVRACLDDVLGIEYVWYPVVGNHETEKPENMEFLRAYNKDGKALFPIMPSNSHLLLILLSR